MKLGRRPLLCSNDIFGSVWREGEGDVAGGDTSTLDVDEGERFF